MQCAECGEVFDAERGACPFCRNTDAANTKEYSEGPAPPTVTRADAPAMTENSNANTSTTQGSAGSTLIEFPGVNRNRPAWRKELSERFREIQQRRAREAAVETEESQAHAVGTGEAEHERAAPPAKAKPTEPAKQLGLVPLPDEPEMNPLVAAAPRRIERARTQTPSHSRQGSVRGQAATAAARVVEEQPERLAAQLPAPASKHHE